MTANLKTVEVVDAIVAAIDGATLSFTPAIVQAGDLSYWIEREQVESDLPAVFVECQSAALTSTTLTGESWGVSYPVRVLIVDVWNYGDDVRDLQQQRAEEVAQVFIGSPGDAFDLGASIAGLQFLQAFPTRIVFDPAESGEMSMDERRRVFVVAVHLEVVTESMRV